jgi:type I restriction-modification system DNA methylase subunit
MQIPLNFNETNEKINIETNIVEKPYKQEYIDIEKGQVYTRSNIVEFMLTSIKLNNCNDLDSIRILEPSC